MRYLLAWILLWLNTSITANDKILNIYNWSNYMPRSVIQQFEKETGIHVNYSEFDSNDTLYAKIKTNPKIGFDIIAPSSYFVAKMRREHMLRKFDKSELPNFKYLNPKLINGAYDPRSEYSIPYFWGAVGIVVNDRYHNPKDFTHWSDLWNPKYHDQLLLLDDPREAFGMALATLGYSTNDVNPKHVHQAYLKLKELMPNIRLFNSDAVENIFIDEDATLGIGWSGDMYISMQENPHIQFIFPQPRFPIWIDCFAIPKYAPHFHNAMLFLNFIMRPEIAKELAIAEGYSSPNMEAMKMLPASMRNNPTFNPPASILKRGEVESDFGNKIDALYEKYWEMLKLGAN